MDTNHRGKSAESQGAILTRRNLLQGAGVALAASVLPGSAAKADTPASAKASSGATGDLTGDLARYMVAARDQDLPPKVTMQ